MTDYRKIIRKEHFINGQWVAGKASGRLQVKDKYTGELLSEIVFADEEQTEQAINAASAGFEKYKMNSAGHRASCLEKLKTELERQKEEFARLIVAEAGKPIDYAKLEISRALSTLETAIRECYTFAGEVVPMDFGNGEGKMAFTSRFAIGPALFITPFNFPLNLAMHKMAPALAVGCSFVLKPPPQAPLTALAFAELCRVSGYPEGVVNVLLCENSQAEKMARDERFKMLSFTGSAAIGWHLKNIAGKKKVTLELGGNAAVIVDETADLPKAASLIAKGAYLYAGQVCISTQRIFILEEIYEKFKALLLRAIGQIETGDPSTPGCVAGPVIDRSHLHRIKNWVEEASSEGAEILCGGKIIDEEKNLFAPTLLTGTCAGMKVLDEEAFGPVAVLEKVKDLEEAIERTNQSRYGLQTGFFSNHLERIKNAFRKIDSGALIVNDVPGFRHDPMPYGGIKDSGLGREGVKYAMEEMTEMKLLVF